MRCEVHCQLADKLCSTHVNTDTELLSHLVCYCYVFYKYLSADLCLCKFIMDALICLQAGHVGQVDPLFTAISGPSHRNTYDCFIKGHFWKVTTHVLSNKFNHIGMYMYTHNPFKPEFLKLTILVDFTLTNVNFSLCRSW